MESKKKVLLVVGTIVVLVCLFAGVFLFQKLGNKGEKNTGTQKEENKSAITDDFSKNDAANLSEKGSELLNLLRLNEVHSCSSTEVAAIYYKKDYTASTLPDGLKIYLGIMQYEESRKFSTSETIILTKEEVRKGVEKVFGPDVSYKDKSYGTKACHGAYDAFTYDEATGNYTLKPVKCDCDASKGEIISKPVKTVETEKEIVVTEKILIAVPSFDQKSQKTTFKIFNTFDFKQKPLAEAETYAFSDYEDKLVSYNFTFKKHKNGNYYFDSVKVVK